MKETEHVNRRKTIIDMNKHTTNGNIKILNFLLKNPVALTILVYIYGQTLRTDYLVLVFFFLYIDIAFWKFSPSKPNTHPMSLLLMMIQ